tara:strand:- start:2104 stop:2499 length:396 start_codon:yes stop_codon:yes gene_type:complete
MKKLRGYIFSRPFLGERVPQHIQNLVLREYCSRKKLQFLLSFVEYRFENSSLMLEKVLNELNRIDGIIFYSLFQMPQDDKERKVIYKKILGKKKEIHFAVEEIKMKDAESVEFVENIFLIKKTLPNCLSKF